MSNTPSSLDLWHSIQRLDESIAAAQAEHDAAEAAHRDALARDIATDALHGDNFFPVVGFDTSSPETITAAAARLASLQKSREIAQGMLAETRERERLARDSGARHRLIEKLKRLDAKAKTIDALNAELAGHLVDMRKIAYECQPIIRTDMNREAPNPSLVMDIAPRVATFLRSSVGGNPMNHEPVAKITADKYSAQVRTAAGITDDE